jgi:hypothetical protein
MLKRIAFPMLALLLLGQVPSLSRSPAPSNDRSNKGKMTLDSIESQAIQVLLDGVGAESLENAKFLAISYDPGEYLNPDTIAANILIWFKYNVADHVIVVNYFLVPWLQKHDDRFLDDWRYSDGIEYRTFLQKIVSDKKIVDTDSIKRLKISLPVSLRNDVWFDKLCKTYEYGLYSSVQPIEERKSKIALEWMTFDSVAPFYHWGIKSSEIQHIQGHSFRDRKLMLQVDFEILNPIIRAILEYETPEEWRNDWQKYKTLGWEDHLARSTCPAVAPNRGNR